MHPNDLDLFDHAAGVAFPGDTDVAAHVAGCERCAGLVEVFAAGEPDQPVQQRPIEHLRSGPLVEALAAAVPDPSGGQVWRTEWDSTVQLVLLVSVSDTTVVAMAVIEAEAADDTSVVLGAALLGWDIAVLTAHAATLPIRVLDRYLGSVDTEAMTRIRQVADGEAGDGDPIVSPLDERWGYRAHLYEILETLAVADWVPEAAEQDLAGLLRATWDKSSALAVDLGITPGQASEILRGDRGLTDEQRHMVEVRLGREIGPGAPSADLVWAFDHPSLRGSWRARAERSGTHDGAAFRWATYTDNNFALAARTTGGLSARERTLAKVQQVLDAGA